MLTVFKYTDYRSFLNDWYTLKKSKNPQFSFAVFAQKAGFKDRGFFHNVLNGKRDLTKESLVQVAQAIGMSEAETDYFENLVFFNKATSPKQRTYFFDKMIAIKAEGTIDAEIQQVRRDQYEFYTQWYHSAIRSLIGMFPFSDDFEWLAKNVFPPITVSQSKKSVALLVKLGLIERQKNGIFKLTDSNISTGKEVASMAVLNFHKDSAVLVKNALETLPPDKRNVSALTLGISENTYRVICREIEAFRSRIINIVEEDTDADRTYNLNFQFIPITKTNITQEGHV